MSKIELLFKWNALITERDGYGSYKDSTLLSPGNEFVLLKDTTWSLMEGIHLKKGTIITLNYDDSSAGPHFKSSTGTTRYVLLKDVIPKEIYIKETI